MAFHEHPLAVNRLDAKEEASLHMRLQRVPLVEHAFLKIARQPLAWKFLVLQLKTDWEGRMLDKNLDTLEMPVNPQMQQLKGYLRTHILCHRIIELDTRKRL
eukprot:134047-Amphidinium_carterae.2